LRTGATGGEREAGTGARLTGGLLARGSVIPNAEQSLR
jgi:hypothetical protein